MEALACLHKGSRSYKPSDLSHRQVQQQEPDLLREAVRGPERRLGGRQHCRSQQS